MENSHKFQSESPFPGSDAAMYKKPWIFSSFSVVNGVLYADLDKQQIRFKDSSGRDIYSMDFHNIKKVKFSQFGNLRFVTTKGKKNFALYNVKGAVTNDFIKSIFYGSLLGHPINVNEEKLRGMLDSYPIQQKWLEVFDKAGIYHNEVTSTYSARKPFKVVIIVFGVFIVLLLTFLTVYLAFHPELRY